jgi:hypothetical protein
MSIALLILLIFGSLISSFIIVNIAYFVMVILAENLVYLVLRIQDYIRDYRTKQNNRVNQRCSKKEPCESNSNGIQRMSSEIAYPTIGDIKKLTENAKKNIRNKRAYLDSNQDLYDFLPTIFFAKYLFHTRFGKRLLGYEYTSNENGKTTKLELNQ